MEKPIVNMNKPIVNMNKSIIILLIVVVVIYFIYRYMYLESFESNIIVNGVCDSKASSCPSNKYLNKCIADCPCQSTQPSLACKYIRQPPSTEPATTAS